MSTARFSLRVLPMDQTGGEALTLPLYEVGELSPLSVADEGFVLEDGRYSFELLCPSRIVPFDAAVEVNGDSLEGMALMPLGSAQGAAHPEGEVACYRLAGASGDGCKAFELTFGFARICIDVAFAGGTASLATCDIPCFSSRHSEQQVRHMLDALLDSSSDVLQWMFSEAEGDASRFSRIEGGLTGNASKSLSTYVQLIQKTARFLEDNVNYFRLQARSRIGRETVRVSGAEMREVGPREVRWIAKNASVLQRVPARTGISHAGACYLPRYVETERQVKSCDLYEHQLLFALIDDMIRVCTVLDQGLSDGLASASEVLRRMRGSACPEGYNLPSLVLVDCLAAREGELLANIRSVRRRLLHLRRLYREALPGVRSVPFAKPRFTKVFRELRTYNALYQHAARWHSQGDLSFARESLAFHVLRLDKLYEYYVLLGLLESLQELGFRPSRQHAPACERAWYEAPNALYANERTVCTLYHLERDGVQLDVYYQPVLYGWDHEEHGIGLHRLTRKTRFSPCSTDSFFTPDYLLVVHDGTGARRSIVLDAKFSSFATQTRSSEAFQAPFMRALTKYKLEVGGGEHGENRVDAVWLICGREAAGTVLPYEDSSWARGGGAGCRTCRSGLVSFSGSRAAFAGVLSELLS